MRPFEIVITVILLGSFLLRFLKLNKFTWLNLLPLLNLLSIAYHLFLEGARWQMIPLYILSIWIIPFALQRIRYPQTLPKIRRTITGLIVLILGASLPILMPVPKFPKPSGPYPVGTQTFYWVDESRLEVFSDDSDLIYANPPSQPRKVMVQVWYPAAAESGDQLAPYLPDGVRDALAISNTFELPGFFLSHLALSKTNALQNAPLAACFDQWPVLIFSHGWQGMRYQSTTQMENLASQGYIVFAPEHAYGAVISVFPDGSSIANNPKILPEGVSDDAYTQAALILGDSWVGDLVFTLDQIDRLQSGQIPSVFSGHIQTSKIGLFGHSTGGGAALQTCAIDSRCKAVLAEDPWLVPYNRELPTKGVSQPTLLVFSEAWKNERNIPLLHSFWEAQPTGTARMTIHDTKHFDFTDIPLYSPLAALLGFKGPIPVQQEIPLLNDFLTGFFDLNLVNPNSNLLSNAVENYPGNNFEIK